MIPSDGQNVEITGAQSLDDLAAAINREHELCVLAALSALQHAIQAGEALLVARERVPHGQWERWLDGHCPAVRRQARPYMRIASYRDVIPPEVRTLTDGLKSLRGLPAFDGTGPARHPREVRERALELLGEGLSRRMVASLLAIDRKAVDRWLKGAEGKELREKREGTYRRGRPTKVEQERRDRVVANLRPAVGPAALANCFRGVWEAHRAGDRPALAEALNQLVRSAGSWAEQLQAVVDEKGRAA